jgi:hypothetical protein
VLISRKLVPSGKATWLNHPQAGAFWERGWCLLGKKVVPSGKEPFLYHIEKYAFFAVLGVLNTIQIYL